MGTEVALRKPGGLADGVKIGLLDGGRQGNAYQAPTLVENAMDRGCIDLYRHAALGGKIRPDTGLPQTSIQMWARTQLHRLNGPAGEKQEHNTPERRDRRPMEPNRLTQSLHGRWFPELRSGLRRRRFTVISFSIFLPDSIVTISRGGLRG